MSEQDVTLDEFAKENEPAQSEGEARLPEIGEIPDDWKLVTVNDIASKILGGGTPSKSNEEYWGGNIPWASVKDLGEMELAEPEDYITEDGVENSATNIIPANSVIISTRMTVGEPFLNTVEMAINQDMKAILPNSGQVNALFLVYSLWDKDSYLKSLGRGTTVDGITTQDLSRTHLGLPSLEEQRKIASVLYTVDEAIQNTEQVLQTIRTIKQGSIQELFTEGYFEHDEKHGDQWASFPKDWELVSIEDLIRRGTVQKVMDGNHGERHPTSEDFVSTGTPFVTSNVVHDSQVQWADCKHLEEETVENLRKGFAKPGDVLLTHKGHVGRVGRIPESVDLAVLSPQVTYYRTNKEISADFLMYYFLSPHIQKQLQAHSTQTTRDYVGITKQKQLQIALPPLDEQQRTAEVLSEIDSRISKEIELKESFQRLKQGLMQDLLSGNTRTTDAAIEVLEEIKQHG